MKLTLYQKNAIYITIPLTKDTILKYKIFSPLAHKSSISVLISIYIFKRARLA